MDREFVETLVLVFEGGVAVTLLNWSASPIERLEVEVATGFQPNRVESARLGALAFDAGTEGTVRVALPLGSADILTMAKP